MPKLPTTVTRVLEEGFPDRTTRVAPTSEEERASIQATRLALLAACQEATTAQQLYNDLIMRLANEKCPKGKDGGNGVLVDDDSYYVYP